MGRACEQVGGERGEGEGGGGLCFVSSQRAPQSPGHASKPFELQLPALPVASDGDTCHEGFEEETSGLGGGIWALGGFK